MSVQKLSEYISGRNHLYIQTSGFPPTFKYSKIRKLEKSERRKSERNSFLACSFPAALEVHSGEANVYFLKGILSKFLDKIFYLKCVTAFFA